jgi:hypothetical protein
LLAAVVVAEAVVVVKPSLMNFRRRHKPQGQLRPARVQSPSPRA